MGLDRNPAQRPAERPRCSACGRHGCRGHEPYDRCSTLVDEGGVLVWDLRGEDRTDASAGRVREGGQGRT